MTLRKPDLHMLTVWRIRLLLVALGPSFVSAYFLPRRGLVWWLFTAAWAGAFLYCYIFYYPIKYRKCSYSTTGEALLLHCGVIYTRVKAMPLTSIQYATVVSTPLQRLFGVRSLHVYAAGASLCLPGLPPEEADRLQRLLTPRPPEGGAPHA